jgi:beta-galactosidase
VMVFGATMIVENLDDLHVVDQMAKRMECPTLFELSNWADVHISRGDEGSFLFINNYQDDPVETTIRYQGKMLFGSNLIKLPARVGAILPLDWRLNKNVLIHYATAEIIEVNNDGAKIEIKAAQEDFVAEVTARGYSCEQSIVMGTSAENQRVRIYAKDGIMVFNRLAQ